MAEHSPLPWRWSLAPLDIFAITRFAQEFDEAELVEACVDAYAHHYSDDYAALA